MILKYSMNLASYQHIKDQIESFVSQNPNWVVIIRWATATWKTSLSVELAKEFDSEVISADSRQIYQHMDIWTDKIEKEIRDKIPHHQIDFVDPKETYTAGQRKAETERLIPEIQARCNIPFIVWGTWLYIDTIYKNFSMPEVPPDMAWREMMMKQEDENPWFLLNELRKVDPEEALKHHPHSTRYIVRALEIFHKTWEKKSHLAKELPVKRPLLMIGLWREKDDTNRRINKRIKQMLKDERLVQEVRSLLERGYTLEHTAMNGIWYKEVVWYIQGEYGLERCEELLKRNTHRYAKRQRSRFRRYIMDKNARPKEDVLYEVIRLQE